MPLQPRTSIDDKGDYIARRSDGTVVSNHDQEKEALQACINAGVGDYTMERPPCEIKVRLVEVADAEPTPEPDPQPEPEPPAEPDPEPPVEPDPPAGGDLVFGQDNSPIAQIPKPTRAQPQVDPAYGLLIEQATDAGDSDNGAGWIRNDYSRRQAFNCDESCYIAVAQNGWWWQYDTSTRLPILRFKRPDKPSNALLQGSCEPIWHPTDPNKLNYHAMNGGMVLSMATIDRAAKAVTTADVADFRGRLPWADVAHCWMKDEGAPSFDGRYWCFQAETQDFRIRGAFVYDLEAGKVLGTRGLTSRPDHVSMSASGRYAVLSGSDGTIAYDRDTFEPVRQLHHRSEHSDLGLLPNGHDYYVSIDYQSNAEDVFVMDIDSGERKALWPVYGDGGGGAFHFSAKAYHRPGVVCVSCYGGGSKQKWFNGKVFLYDLVDGRIVNLCHHRSRGTYYGEPHATISPTGRHVLFNSNWYTGQNDGHCAYMLEIPDSAYAR